jgi:unsaturated rhamnogalacturonyl hydrolase
MPTTLQGENHTSYRWVVSACTSLLVVWSLGTAAGQQSDAARPKLPPSLGELQRIAALPGEPQVLSAGGVTRSENPLLTIENKGAFGNSEQRRLVMVGALNGDERGARAILGAVAWFKTKAPESVRRAWAVSVMPSGDPEQHARVRPYQFPPLNGFFDDADQPESRYTWRWATFQAPDLVLEVWGGDSMSWYAKDFSALSAAPLPRDSLASAMAGERSSNSDAVPAILVTARATDGPQLLEHVLKAAGGLPRSALHSKIVARTVRSPLEIAGVLARRYPANAVVSYIPSVAWTSTLRLAAITGDASLRQRVRQQTLPWVSGERPLFGEQIGLAAAAGTMVYAELAVTGDESARALAIQGAEAVSAERPNGIAQYGQGWPEDMFMTAAVLSRTGKMPGRARDLDRLANRLIAYAARLQREDGIFIHFTDGRQPWGRGNGFAALGLMDGLNALPPTHPLRERILTIYRRQMKGLVPLQAPDGMWRQIVDQPGSYREESVTAMVLSAMARGIRLGWLDQTYRPVVERAWQGLAAHVMDDGSIVDVCTSTGAGPTRRYYLDRAAITGADDRGGAMALLAAIEMYELSR